VMVLVMVMVLVLGVLERRKLGSLLIFS